MITEHFGLLRHFMFFGVESAKADIGEFPNGQPINTAATRDLESHGCIYVTTHTLVALT